MTLVMLPPVDRILLAVLERDKTIPVATGLVLPTSLGTSLPVVTISVLGGSSTQTESTTTLDVNVYAATRGGASGGRAVCAMVEAILVQAPHSAVVDGRRFVLDTVDHGAFHEVPWDDETVRHYLATVGVRARRA